MNAKWLGNLLLKQRSWCIVSILQTEPTKQNKTIPSTSQTRLRDVTHKSHKHIHPHLERFSSIVGSNPNISKSDRSIALLVVFRVFLFMNSRDLIYIYIPLMESSSKTTDDCPVEPVVPESQPVHRAPEAGPHRPAGGPRNLATLLNLAQWLHTSLAKTASQGSEIWSLVLWGIT